MSTPTVTTMSPPDDSDDDDNTGSRSSRRRENDLKKNHTHNSKDPFSTKITDCRIPKSLEKPPKLQTYDGTGDPDEHVEHIDTILDYHGGRGGVRCKLFVQTLKGSAMTWLKSLPDKSVRSWTYLYTQFFSHLITCKLQPKTVASLGGIVQGKDETLRDYIERFTREAVKVKGADEKLKCFIFKKGLRAGVMFKQKLGLKEPKNMSELLIRAQPYINYEEKLIVKVQESRFELGF
ncbi:hypothetical protein A2U01_0023764 [Trifolium medium]|uniref:Retrotransposon gag domain-containing protein n=1 Tax=Trifolium medium TaxID=97028 RepID=A0A392NU31_9FABA|nr:hypothetical protein [Trifolium medium]